MHLRFKRSYPILKAFQMALHSLQTILQLTQTILQLTQTTLQLTQTTLQLTQTILQLTQDILQLTQPRHYARFAGIDSGVDFLAYSHTHRVSFFTDDGANCA